MPAEGHLVLFAVRADGVLGRMWRTTHDAGWSEWESAGVSVRSAPAAVRTADGRAVVFAAGERRRLGYASQLDAANPTAWSEWAEAGPEIRSEPAVVANADGRLEVFAVGPDGFLGHLWQLEEGEWSEWHSFGYPVTSRPAVVENRAGRLEVFAVDADGRLGHVWKQFAPDGGNEWSQWHSIGQAVSSPPAVSIDAEGRIEVAAPGVDGSLGHLGQRLDPGGMVHWLEWRTLNEAVQGAPALCQNRDGRLEVFAVGTDGKLGYARQALDPSGETHFSAWQSLGHVVSSTPVAFRRVDGLLTIVAVGAGGRLGQIGQREHGETVAWGDWEDLGAQVSELRPAIAGSVALARSKDVRRPLRPRPEGTLSADVLVVGAGPAGITISDGLVRAGARVILVDSGDWNQDFSAQDLNHGDADGPVIKGHLKYLRFGRRRQVQGSAAIWGRGWLMPFRSIDFERRPWVPGSSWPIGHADLEPYERRASSTLGIDAFQAPRPDGSLVQLSYHYPSTPFLFRATLAELLTNAGLRAELLSTALKLEVSGDRINSVRLARADGGEFRVNADTVVLAAGGIENARLLLLHEGVLPVSAAMAGRCFMDHPHVVAGTVRVPDPDLLDPFLDKGRTLDVLALPDATQRREGLLNASVQLLPTGPTDSSEQSAEASLYLRVEQAPNPDSQVMLTEERDRFGCRRPYLQWLPQDQDWQSVVQTAELVAGALVQEHGLSAELSIREDVPWPGAPAGPNESRFGTWGNHHMGTTRMAADPAEGVVDSNCLVGGTTNLYVAGSSVFATGGCANPTFMIVALAHRLTDHLAGR